jgi:hypothetical protein
MAISFAAMENQRILSSNRALFFSKITGNEYLRLCNARNIEQQDLTEKIF